MPKHDELTRAKRLAAKKQYRVKHRKKISAAQRAWRIAHRDELLAYGREWYRRNRQSELAKAKVNREAKRKACTPKRRSQ